VKGSTSVAFTDTLSVEEPLEIRLTADVSGGRTTRVVAVTMRTPGDDGELGAGFLFSEGIISEHGEIEEICAEGENVIGVTVRRGVEVDSGVFERHSFVASGCGVCGKRSIAAVRVRRKHSIAGDGPRCGFDVIHSLPGALRAAQTSFGATGGIHAAGLFDEEGKLLVVREDIGRHNALDKVIGAEFLAGALPLARRIVLVSGRASFELVQKAAQAGAPILAAVGAPSSLALELARECGMTLLGFVRDGGFNVYCGRHRIGR
jgi:FdhD protein